MRLARPAPAALAALLVVWPALGAVDPFYTSLLKQGRDAYRERRPAEAAEQLRIASFGLLEDPVLLTEALVRLALAQRAAGREADAQGTLARFADAEQRFHAYAKASLEPDVRSEFEGLLGHRVAGGETAAAAPAAAPPPAPAKTEARAPARETAPKDTPNETSAKISRNGGSALQLAREAAARADVARARKTLGMPAESGELAPPAPSAAPPAATAAAPPRTRANELLAAVAKDPKNRDLRKELLEAAYLAKDWETGASQIAALEPFQDGEEPWMFYASVSAWEIGRQDAARTLLRRARPRISDDPFVDLYTKKILGK